MKLRRLNDAGICRMAAFLDSLTTESPEACPVSILTDSSTSEALAVDVSIERAQFLRRYEAALFLYERLSGSALREPERDAGLWAWLALFWFDQLCPADENGRRRPGEQARWIPRIDVARRYYRHLLLGPYLIYAAHDDNPQRAMCLLCQPIHVVGHIYYQLVSRQNLITAPGVVEAATEMYYDPRRDALRRGSQTIGTEGSVFRFASVLMQFDRTFDLHMLSGSQVLELLPPEFSRFRLR